MKKILCCLLTVVFMLSFVTACSPDADSLYDYEDVTGGVKITNYKGKKTEIVIPEIINNKKVVSVGNTFSGNVTIKSVTLPQSCVKGNFIGCDSLEYLEFPGCTNWEFDDYCPSNIKKLILPGIEEINFSYSGFSGFTELEYLDISGARELLFCDGLDYFTKLKTICVSGTFDFFGNEKDSLYDDEYVHYSFSEEERVTSDNYMDVMKSILGEQYEIKVNNK